MASFKDARVAIESRFSTMWGATTPISWENARFEQTAGTSFVHLNVFGGRSFQASMGDVSNRLFRDPGQIEITIFTPIDDGPGPGLDLADSVAAIFRAVEFSGVLTFAPRIGRPESTDNGNWYSTTVLTTYQFDACF